MDPLSALGIACNVMQLISFSYEAISITRHVYDKGAVNEDVVDKAAHLEALTGSLDIALMNSKQPHAAAEKVIIQIAKKCNEASRELQKTMAELVSSSTKGSVVRSTGTSIKVMWKHNRIQKLEKNMMQWQRVLDSGMLVRLYSKNEAQALQQSESFERLNGSLKNVVDGLSRGNYNLTNMIAAESIAVKLHVTSTVSQAKLETQAHVTAESKAVQDNLTQRLEDFHLTAAMEARREKLLLSLKYDGFNGRKNMIAKSHAETFQWIYSRDLHAWSSFVDWLGSSEKLYWISGKPGSGKSTLMKLIADDKRTLDLLAPNTIIISYYLWSVGSPMQRSLRGVFLSLLHQLLADDRIFHEFGSIHPKAFSWKDAESDWSLSELEGHVRDILLNYTYSRPICIFLDGLDEISPSEGPLDIIDLADELSAIPGVKLCVSSRPEPAFKRRYSSVPSLRLQDLTEPDIRKVCEGLLKEIKDDIPEDGILPGTKSRTKSSLISELTRKAEGVFLWVVLALKSIRRGYSNSDSWDDLLKRMNALPSDLNELYSSMWKRANIDHGIYEPKASLYLNLILESSCVTWTILMSGAISAFELVMATEDSIQNAVFDDEGSLSPARLEAICRPYLSSIEARCAGLVDFDGNYNFDDEEFRSKGNKWDSLIPFTKILIHFVHRSASDFLTDTEGGKEILQMDKTTLASRRLRLIRQSLVRQTLWPLSRDLKRPKQWNDTVGRVLFLTKTWIPEDLEHEIEEVEQYAERIWTEVCSMRKGICPGELHPDFMGLLASEGFCSSVKTRIGKLEAARGRSITSSYRDYLLHTASNAAAKIYSPKVAEGGLQLIHWIQADCASFSRRFFDLTKKRTLLALRISLMTPLMVLLAEVIDELTDPDYWEQPDTISVRAPLPIVQQLSDLIGQVVENHEAILPDQKLALEIMWSQPSALGPVWISSQSFSLRHGNPQRGRGLCCHVEVNTAFLLQLFKDVVEAQAPKLRTPSDTAAFVPIKWVDRVDCPPSVKLLFYNEPDDPDDTFVLQAPPDCFLREDALREIIRANFQPGVRPSDMRRLRSEMSEFILQAVGKANTREVQTSEAFLEQFKEYSFYEWPPPAELAMEYPPPMFD